ncbi:MAG: hypothetical protein ACE5NW_13710 [Acidiferrobacterales bacterium]
MEKLGVALAHGAERLTADDELNITWYAASKHVHWDFSAEVKDYWYPY